MYEQDPRHLRNSHIVAQAAEKWLRERGLDFSMRDVIRSSHRLHEINQSIVRQRRLDQIEFEEEMKVYEEQDETETQDNEGNL